MLFVDADVMIDILRGYPPAPGWLESLGDQELILPGLVVMELMEGCQDKSQMDTLASLLEPFAVHWPTQRDCDRAIADFARGHLSHRLGILDALIGQCAVGANVALCTFNESHFRAVSGLKTMRPYGKA